ncbi:TonB-dependent receptor [Oxalobacteraceae bacterium A2-2]
MKLKMKSMPLVIMQLAASGALSAAISAPVLAQSGDESMQRVVVTGSYITRADKETSSPVQVITADEMKKQGYTTVSEVLRDLTANGQGTISQSFNRAFAGGASGVSLRGLTVGATLVLIDGHRMAPYPLSDDGQRSFVDISNIPFDAIDHIDVLKDGASSTYGSDAIAGVVNVVLKKSFKGTAISAEGGTSEAGGGETGHVTLTHGWGDLDQDGWTAFGSIEYRKQKKIMLTQRADKDWARTDWRGEGGLDLTPGAVNDLTPFPRTLVPYLYNPTTRKYAIYAGGCQPSASSCDFTDPWAQIQPETSNLNVVGSFVKKLAGDWQLNLKASMMQSKDAVETTPVFYPAGSYAGNTALAPGVAPTQVGVIPSFLVPANYPGNTTGGPARVYGYLTDLGGRMDNVDSKSYRVVGEVSGSAAGWDLSAALGYTRINTTQTYSGYVDRLALYNALNDPTNPYKITGGNSAAANAAISPTFSSRQTDELDFAEVHGSRAIAQLPGGDLSLALGASYIYKKLNAPAANEFASGQINGNTAFAMGTEKNAAVFGELRGLALKELELGLSGRYDHYDTYGHSATPKADFKYTPNNWISVRGTYSRGFRAPGPAENGTAGSSFSFNQVNDPQLCPGGDPKAAGVVSQYCLFSPGYVQVTSKDLQPEKSKSHTLGLILEPVKGWSTTIDYYSIEIKNQIVTAASLPGYVPAFVRGTPTPQVYSDGKGGTYVATPSVGQILYATSGYVNANATKTTGVDLNTEYTWKKGDLGNFKAGLNLSHMISYTLTAGGQDYELAGTHGPTVISGDTGNPKNRAQLTLGYEKGPFTASATVNWIDSYSVLDPSTGGANDDCETSLQNSNLYFASSTYPTHYCRVNSFTTTNLNLTYKVNDKLTLRGSILNLFDRQAPIDAQTYGGTSIASGTNAPYNPSLHQAGAVGRYFSVGANYTF